MGYLEEDRNLHFLKAALNDIRERWVKTSQPYFLYDVKWSIFKIRLNILKLCAKKSGFDYDCDLIKFSRHKIIILDLI